MHSQSQHVDQIASVPIDVSSFRRVAGQWVTGVAVVTTINEIGTPVGLTMNGVTSLSLAPPQFLICLGNHSETLVALRHAKVFCINFLSKDQQDLSAIFATKGTNKFERVDWKAGVTGAPIICNSIGYMELRLKELVSGGDHQIAIGEVIAADVQSGAPLVYFNGRYGTVD